MAHVELSWTGSPPHEQRIPSSLERSRLDPAVERWAAAVDEANEPCMVIDSFANIVSMSQSACALLGFGSAREAIGQCLYDRAFPLLDFTSERAELNDDEIQRTPPVLALTSGLLARGVLRVRGDGRFVTMDAVSTPLKDGAIVLGSLTFFCLVE